MSKGLVSKRAGWKALGRHGQKMRTVHLRDLFSKDPARGRRLTLDACGLYLDYSKNRITDDNNDGQSPDQATLWWENGRTASAG